MNRHVSLSRIKHDSAPSGNRVAWKPENVPWRHNRRVTDSKTRYTAICTRQSRKVLWDMINTLFLALSMSTLLFLLTFSTHNYTSIASRAIPSNFFEKRWTPNHPQYLSGFCRVHFFPHSRNSCIYKADSCFCLAVRSTHVPRAMQI